MREPPAIHCPIPAHYPITPCDPAEIAPLLAHLEADVPVSQPTAFPRGTVLEDGRLDLCKQSIGPDGCRRITAALRYNTTISSLLLGTDGIGDSGAAEVARLLESNSALTTVYLGCNNIGPQGMAPLAQSLEHNAAVRGLWLKRNPIGADGAKSLANLLRRNTSLRILDLVNALPGVSELSAILDVLTHENRTVERLYLGGNGLGEKEAERLAALLRANAALKGLFLNVNHLGDAGAFHLANALRENRTLNELGLASNGIGSAGGAALFDAVCQHPALTHLDLGYPASTRTLGAPANAIGDTGAESVGACLSENRSLRWLDLRHNAIRSIGNKAIRVGLENNTTLCRLFLDGSPDPLLEEIIGRNQQQEPASTRAAVRDIAAIRSVYRTL